MLLIVTMPGKIRLIVVIGQGLMDQIDEEQDNNFKISAQKRALEAELSDVKSNIELLESSIKTVSVCKRR